MTDTYKVLQVRQPTDAGKWHWAQHLPPNPNLRGFADLVARIAAEEGVALDHRAEWVVVDAWADLPEDDVVAE